MGGLPKNPGKPKLYAPEVECISKCKSRNPYEFGVKVGIATTLKGNLIVGVRTFPGNPYDGHTLHEQVEQASILMQATGVRPQTVYVDLGYRGVDQANPDITIKHRGRFKSLTDEERKNLKRRQAIEPIIGHLKVDHRMNRCHLLGAGWRQLPWPVNDNYVGRLEAYTGRVREAGLPLDLRTQIEGSKHARQENHGPPSAQVQTTPQQAQPSSFCR